MVQTYSRQLERMDSVEHRQANMLLNSSGRNTLRGRKYMFGELGQASGASARITDALFSSELGWKALLK